MFAVLDYRGCYRALLYIGYDRKLDECFSVVRGKSRYSDLLRIRERRTYSILLVEDEQHSQLLGPLFGRGEEGHFAREVRLFSGKNSSKVLNLFKVRERNLHSFLSDCDLIQR